MNIGIEEKTKENDTKSLTQVDQFSVEYSPDIQILNITNPIVDGIYDREILSFEFGKVVIDVDIKNKVLQGVKICDVTAEDAKNIIDDINGVDDEKPSELVKEFDKAGIFDVNRGEQPVGLLQL